MSLDLPELTKPMYEPEKPQSPRGDLSGLKNGLLLTDGNGSGHRFSSFELSHSHGS